MGLMSTLPTQLTGVTAVTKANVYFDGKVVSHTLLMPDGARKTLGLIYPGSYHFGTDAPERMTVVSGQLHARLPGGEWQSYAAGTYFEVPANSSFDVQAVGGPAAYLCEFLGKP